MANLDYLAAKYAQEIVKNNIDNEKKAEDIDNMVTKALGVLQENGIYACGLFLLSQSQHKEIANVVCDKMIELLKEPVFPFDDEQETKNTKQKLSFLTEQVINSDLEQVLLAKETLEQMLIYARYGAKARKQGS